MGGGDMTYGGSKIGCLSIGESGAYLIAACLPTFRTLLRAVKPKPAYSYGSAPSNKFPSSNKSKNTKNTTELSSMSKSGFSRLSNDKGSAVSTTSDEEILVPASGDQRKPYSSVV
jgi:hypothetical protein